MNEKISLDESKEQLEKIRILIHFLRHDKKEGDKTKSDTEIRLTEEGKLHAQSLASEETDMSQTMAFGSPRKRTQETAGLVMAGGQEEITGTETLEELNGKLNKNLKYGKKIVVDKRLDFTLPEKGTVLYDEELAAFTEGRLLKYLVEESDVKAAELGVGPEICAYSNQASQVAEIVQKYLKVLPRWESLARDKNKGYKPTMERFMGTHQTVAESFLAKVIEVTKGVAERDTFVATLGNQGFDFAEGFNVEIITEDDEEKVHISYKKEKDGKIAYEYDEILPRSIIDKMIIAR